MSSPEQTTQPSELPLSKRQPIGLTILDWVLIVLAVATSAIALLGSRSKTAAEPNFEITDVESSAGDRLKIEIDGTNQVNLAGQSVKEVQTLVELIKARNDLRQATIVADEDTLFATTDWVATTLINSGVDRVQVVTGKRVETKE